MWVARATAETTATPDAVWELWTDVERWKEWDRHVLWSRLDGPFAPGSKGEIKPAAGPKASFVLTEVVPERRFTDCLRLPFATLEYQHELTPVAEGWRITHRVQINGPLAFLFNRIIGRTIAAELPTAVRNLARLADRDIVGPGV